MTYNRSQMLFEDYKWEAIADHDNPFYKMGIDYSEMNRNEGYEVLYFINHIAPMYWIANIQVYRKLENLLRLMVPETLKTHRKITDWLIINWDFY